MKSIFEPFLELGQAGYIDMKDVVAPRNIYERLLNQFFQWTPCKENGYGSICKCEHMGEFIEQLERLNKKQKFIVTFLV